MKKLIYPFAFIVLLLAGTHCSAQIITTIAGNGGEGDTGDGGPASAALISNPYGNALDDSGNLYIADYGNSKVRKISRSGIITTIGGNGSFTYTGDGGPATAAGIIEVLAVAVDTAHIVYVVDGYSNVVRKISAAGIIRTVAGNGTSGYTGNGGAATAAQLHQPTGVAVDDTGNLYIADAINNVVRKVNTAGIISTFAGTGTAGYTGDMGTALTAKLHLPQGVATDHNGNVYIADSKNYAVRRVDAAGIISTIAGNGVNGYSGDGGPATAASITQIQGITLDNAGNLFIGDLFNNVVRKVNTAGIITTFAGNGFVAGVGLATGSYTGDGGRADSAGLNAPSSISVDRIGNVYISDHSNEAIRKVTAISGIDHICINDSVTLNVAIAGGSWASSAPSVAHVNAALGIVRAVSAGTAVIYYSSGTDTATITVFISAVPDAGTITGTDTLCVTTSTMLTSSVPGGTWSVANENAFHSGEMMVGVLPGLDTAIYTVSYSCGTATAIFPFMLIQPAFPTISGPTSVCVGQSITFSADVPGGTWELSNTTIATLTAPGVVQGLAEGLDQLNYTVSSSLPGCVAINIITFTVNPASDCMPTGVGTTATGSNETHIYPNPSSGRIYVELQAINEERTITITDLYGRLMQLQTLAPNTTKTAISQRMPAGTYILNIQGGTKADVHRITVE